MAAENQRTMTMTNTSKVVITPSLTKKTCSSGGSNTDRSALSEQIDRVRKALDCTRPWERCREWQEEAGGICPGRAAISDGYESSTDGDDGSTDYMHGEFHDCRSNFSESDYEDEDDFFQGHSRLSSQRSLYVEATDRDLEVVAFVDGRCIYPSDGSPAHVPPGRCKAQAPSEYILACRGDMVKAQCMWEETVRWRTELRLWDVLTRTNVFFHEIKAGIPHYLHGYARLEGESLPVMWEQSGKIQLNSLFGRNCCGVDGLLEHCIFNNEYISNVACAGLGGSAPPVANESWGYVTIMDFEGFSMLLPAADMLRYLAKAGKVASSHYPNAIRKIVAINTPPWLPGFWSTVRRVLPGSIGEKVSVVSSDYGNVLSEFMERDEIPREYGGKSPYRLGEHPMEVGLRDLVAKASERSGGGQNGASDSVDT